MAFLALTVTVSATAVPEARAQASRTEQYFQDWSVLCLVSAEGVKQCNMIQARIRTDRQRNVFRWVISRDGEGREVNFLQAPLGAALTAGVRLSVEGEEIDTVPYEVCDRTWCQARYPMSEALLGYFAEGMEIEIQYENARQQPISTQITANGFQEALQHFRNQVE